MNEHTERIAVVLPDADTPSGGRAALVQALARLLVGQACDTVVAELPQQRKAG